MKLSIIIISLLLSCGTARNGNTNTKMIAFGNGGGFAGIETKYLLYSTGDLMKVVGADTAKIKSLPAPSISTYFRDAEAIRDYKYFKPGNIYNFIEFDGNRITWSSTDTIDKNILDLYNKLFTLTK